MVVTGGDDEGEDWAFAERTLEADMAEWLSVKRENAGMFGLTVGEWLLIHETSMVSDKKVKPRKHGSLSDGIAATDGNCGC